MKSLFLSLRALMLIGREQSAREKMYKRREKLIDFYNKYETETYEMKDLVVGQLRLFKKELS